MGGRQRTMLCWADYFKLLGHHTTFYTNFTETRPGFDQGTFLEWFPFTELDYYDISIVPSLKRRMAADEIPAEWHGLDVLVVPYGGYGYLQDLLPSVYVVAWVIHPDQAFRQSVRRIWTNSMTTRKRLLDSERYAQYGDRINVVVPPHPYEMFRQAAKPFDDRKYDVVAIGSLLHAKGVVEYANLVERGGLKGALVGATWEADRDENAEVLGAVAGRLDVMTNVPSGVVADVLGNSKVFLSMSRAESCPLSTYEALNAGCNCVVRGVGAAVEQLAGAGRVFVHDREALPLVVLSLEKQGPSLQRGRLFDRDTVGHRVRHQLEQIQKEIG